MKNNKGFVVSAILYPLLVLFLALIMGLLAMSDTRKRILDKMKLEISDSIFDDAECSCDTILNKLNYIIKNGVGGGGGNGSYSYNVLGLNVKGYETEDDMPNTGNAIGDIAVITDVEVTSYYVSRTAPKDPKEGNVWIVQDKTSVYHIKSDYSNIGISYVMQYIEDKWVLKKAYVFDEGKWTLLYYVSLKDGIVDMTSSDVNAELVHNFSYTGQYQPFTVVFSGYYQIELWGAGAASANGTYAIGGKGAYTSGEIYLNAGDTLYIYVGGTSSGVTGGWNGGGTGAYVSGYNGTGGAGATDVRLVNTSAKTIWNEFESLKSRIMVAGGGGGGGYVNTNNNGHGGGGGALIGNSASGGHSPGTGGTQASGGSRNTSTANTGDFGIGAAGTAGSYSGGGGGGGYYGGGGGYNYAGGGGGSSYISGYDGCNSIEEDSLSTNIIHNGSVYHYSGNYFINTSMTANNRSGNGAAKITLKTVEYREQKEIDEIRIATNTKWTYMYSGTNLNIGRVQKFFVPKTGKYQIELWGAAGGTANGTYAIGGKGAYTYGNLYLKKGEILYVYVGGFTTSTTGGWNGGGTGAYVSGYNGTGGGGATDIRLLPTSATTTWNEFESLKSRIMVAAGGGGGGYVNTSNTGHGGAGGALTGNNATGHSPGIGGTQVAGGYRNATTANVGTFGIGAAGTAGSYSGGGGGGGYYGGGGGYNYAGGGGGSSYISGYTGCSSIEEESTASNIIHNGFSYHYSDYYFHNAQMLSGSSTQPNNLGSGSQTGQSGSGYAKITLVEETNANLGVDNHQKIIEMNDEWYYPFSNTNILTGRYQLFLATKTGNYKIQLWGAGAAHANTTYAIGGKGAYTYGEIYIPIGTKLYIYIGGTSYGTSGGWNGGGTGAYVSGYNGTGGGGATDVRTVPSTSLSSWNETGSLNSRIMVAAGAGGGGYVNTSNTGHGGSAGGLTGHKATGHSPGTGATQIAGGNRNGNTGANVGGFGYGSIGTAGSYSGGGGGGGYYGGGGGYNYAGGGGGSSYISGHAGCIGVTSTGEKLAETYSKIEDSYSYTDFIFTNTQMVDGAGYPWTTSKSGASSGQPNNAGTGTQTGQSGNGYAKITYLGA